MAQQRYESRSASSYKKPQNGNQKKRKKKKKKSALARTSSWTYIAIGCLAIALIAGVAAFFLLGGGFSAQHDPTLFLEGVCVNGISISGKTTNEAKQLLKAAEDDSTKNISVALSLDGTPYTINASQLSFTYNTDEILAEAINLCKTADGEIDSSKAKELAETGKNYTISYTVTEDSIRNAITQLSAQIDKPATNASMGLYDAANPPSITDSQGNPIELVIAGSGRFYYVPEENGITVDQAQLTALVVDAIANKQTNSIQIPYQSIIPETTVESLQNSIVLRGFFRTTYKSSKNRDKNLVKAAELCNNFTLLPGETFSANDTLGPRTTENGWYDAPAIIAGGAGREDQPGGGVCQVSTTMYNAVVIGDLEVVYRRNHSTPSNYVKGGLDATINTNTIDFKWRNNTSMPIYMFMWIDTTDKTVNCELYGAPFATEEYDEIKFISEKISDIKPPEGIKYVLDKEMPNGACELYNKPITGSKWQSYKVYYKNGVEVKREKEAVSTYNAHQETWHYGPGWVSPTPTLSPTPTASPSPTPNQQATPTPEPTPTPATEPTDPPTT